MFKKTAASALSVIAMVFSLAANAEEGYNINPGMWETTHETKISGVPQEMAAMMQQPPKVERECIKDNKYDFNPDNNPKECTFKSTRHSSKKLSWDIECGGNGSKSSGHGEVNFNGDTVSGWFEMDILEGPAGPMKMRQEFKGKRIGSC